MMTGSSACIAGREEKRTEELFVYERRLCLPSTHTAILCDVSLTFQSSLLLRNDLPIDSQSVRKSDPSFTATQLRQQLLSSIALSSAVPSCETLLATSSPPLAPEASSDPAIGDLEPMVVQGNGPISGCRAGRVGARAKAADGGV